MSRRREEICFADHKQSRPAILVDVGGAIPRLAGGYRMCRFGFMFVGAFLCASVCASQLAVMDRTLTIYVDEGHVSATGHVFVEFSYGPNHNFYGFYPSAPQQHTFANPLSLTLP